MILAIFFSLLLAGALLAAAACWVAFVWLLGEHHADPETAPSLSLSQTFARKLEQRWLWRSLSAWMAARPLRLEHRGGRTPR